MGGMTRVIHPATNFLFGEAGKLCPDVKLQAVDQETDQEIEMFALVCHDPDGEQHVYLLDEGGKKNLLGVLTQGVIVETSLAAVTQLPEAVRS